MAQILTNPLAALTTDTNVAFGWNYNGGEPNDVAVGQPTSIKEDKVLFHFMYGHHAMAEWVEVKNIIGIADKNETNKIKGWGGTYKITNIILYERLCK